MRKSVLALAAAGGVFALTGAAASTLTVSGPLNPRAGSDTRSCDLGDMTVTTLDDGTNITGFRVTATTASDGQECTGSTVWVAIDDTTVSLPAGWDGTNAIGAAGDAGDIRFSVAATAFTTAASKAVTFEYATGATNKIYGWNSPTPASGYVPFTLDPKTAKPLISAVTLGSSRVLLSESTPSTGAFLTPQLFTP